jgi:uncharacterized membrane protein
LLRDSQVQRSAVLDEAKRRSEKFHLRLADHITALAGSMNFVLIHMILFAVWIGTGRLFMGTTGTVAPPIVLGS